MLRFTLRRADNGGMNVSRTRSSRRQHFRRVTRARATAVLATGALGLAAAGCGGSAPVDHGVARHASAVLLSINCTSAGSIARSGASGTAKSKGCVFTLSDGRRFQCSASAFPRAAPSADTLVHARACGLLPPDS